LIGFGLRKITQKKTKFRKKKAKKKLEEK